jgi:hypothetical protein
MKGICFIEPLHDKTVKGLKVQTRRIINPQPLEIVCSTIIDNKLLFETRDENDAFVFLKPRYKVGDVLYLKEPYIDDSDMFFTAYPIHETLTYNSGTTLYQYGNDTSILDSIYGDKVKWKNKLFMGAKYARLFVEITAVRGERLQDISNEDCIKEGIEEELNIHNDKQWFTYCNGTHSFDTPREAYKALINSIDGKDTWNNNPWVWVYDYELIDRKEVQL